MVYIPSITGPLPASSTTPPTAVALRDEWAAQFAATKELGIATIQNPAIRADGSRIGSYPDTPALLDQLKWLGDARCRPCQQTTTSPLAPTAPLTLT